MNNSLKYCCYNLKMICVHINAVVLVIKSNVQIEYCFNNTMWIFGKHFFLTFCGMIIFKKKILMTNRYTGNYR